MTVQPKFVRLEEVAHRAFLSIIKDIPKFTLLCVRTVTLVHFTLQNDHYHVMATSFFAARLAQAVCQYSLGRTTFQETKNIKWGW